MSLRDERWFLDVRATPERERVYSYMCAYEEGLGPRAYRCLLQMADGAQPSQSDLEWLTDGVEQPSLARIDAASGRCVLTAYGRLLMRAIDAGDYEQVFALTTMPELMETAS